MLALVNAVDQPSVKLDDLYFITLTYQQQDQAADASKRDLEKFLKRFERKYGPTWLLWKLEPQKRGTPHYHLLVHLMGRELEEQAELLDEVDTLADRVGGRLQTGLKSMGTVIRRNEEKWSGCCVWVLVFVLVLLLVLVLVL